MKQVSGEYDFEPIKGLPGELPQGERILWQGAPEPWRLAISLFHVRFVAGYFALLLAWRIITVLYDSGGASEAAMASALVIAIALAALGILTALAYAIARTTVYTITSARVVMRFGVALPMTINVPFRVIGSAALRAHPDGTADLPLALMGEDKFAYFHLWPHVRPWVFKRPEPMLRAVADGERAAAILGEALAKYQAHAGDEADATDAVRIAPVGAGSGSQATLRVEAA